MTVPEVRRLLLALTDPPARQLHRLAWSSFRRRHQATAKHCHLSRRTRAFDPQAEPPIQTMAAAPPHLTDAHWCQIKRLLPPETTTGRPPRDHRTVLTGILWVIRTGVGWHQLPEEFGPGATIQRRYRRWCEHGTWEAIIAILLPPHPPSIS